MDAPKNKTHIVLLSPQIPQNTGNIARTCACTNTSLHLIHPLGFEIDDAKLKRAGLDYWHALDVQIHDSFDDFLMVCRPEHFYFVETKTKHTYADIAYPADGELYFIFGKETTGIPEPLLDAYPDRISRIPMAEGLRSLNLSNAAAIVLYEALRQRGYPELY